MKNALLPAAALSLMSVLGVTPTDSTSLASRSSPVLVVEAEIRTVSYAGAKLDVAFLPITLHGRVVTVLLSPGTNTGFALSPELLASQVKDSLSGLVLDSVKIGNVTEHRFAIQRTGVSASSVAQPDLPPVVGEAGNEFLSHYDVVVDGTARRIRLYALSPTGTQAPWLPSGVKAEDCTPMIAMPENNPGFSIQVDGHLMTAIFETNSCCTWINMTGARLFGLKNVNQGTLPPKVRRIKAKGVHTRYLIENVHLALGEQHFVGDTLAITSIDVDQYGSPVPTILMNPINLRRRTLVVSNSTHRVCLGAP